MPMLEREPLRRGFCLALFGTLLLVTAGLGACSPYQVSDRSMDFNASLQDLDNRQVLLNAVRAYKRYPPYFTSVNQISSTGELDGSQINFTLPFGPVSHNVNSAGPMIKVGTGITMQTNPLDTQDFYEGYMAPVKTDLIGYYLDYGWPRQLILHTFLREVDLPADIVQGIKLAVEKQVGAATCAGYGAFTVLAGGPGPVDSCLDNLSDKKLIAMVLPEQSTVCTDFGALNKLPPGDIDAVAKSGGTVIRFINDPSDLCRFATFQLLSAMLDKLQVGVVSVPPPKTAAVPPITIPTADKSVSIKVQNDSASSDTAKVTFALNKAPDPCTLAKPAPAAAKVVKLQQPGAAAQPAAPLALAPKDTQEPHPLPLPTKGEAAPAAATASGAAAVGAAAPANAWQTLCTDEASIKIVPRSPEAIVFYLGELINAQYPEEGPGFVAMVRGVSRPLPLFEVRKGDSGGGPTEVSVSLDGDTYSIPRSTEYNSTMHMLTLVEQVIALQKKGTQIPGIVPVQVINP